VRCKCGSNANAACQSRTRPRPHSLDGCLKQATSQTPHVTCDSIERYNSISRAHCMARGTWQLCSGKTHRELAARGESRRVIACVLLPPLPRPGLRLSASPLSAAAVASAVAAASLSGQSSTTTTPHTLLQPLLTRQHKARETASTPRLGNTGVLVPEPQRPTHSKPLHFPAHQTLPHVPPATPFRANEQVAAVTGSNACKSVTKIH
jgi:hypothetical protein